MAHGCRGKNESFYEKTETFFAISAVKK